MKRETLKAIVAELEAARRQFPGNAGLLQVLNTRVESLWREFHNHKGGISSALAVYMRAVECAVLAIRLIEEGDAQFPYVKNETQALDH